MGMGLRHARKNSPLFVGSMVAKGASVVTKLVWNGVQSIKLAEDSTTQVTPGGHPKRLLAWLANHAAARGHPLKAGMIITTGSHTGMIDAPPGATVDVRITNLGEARLTFAA